MGLFNKYQMDFEVLDVISKGSYGIAYKGRQKSNNKIVCLKYEKKDIQKNQLLYESEIYRILIGSIGFPRVVWFGDDENHFILAMDYIGPSIEDLFMLNGEKFSMKTVLQLAYQMISRLQYIHAKGIVHRDIKPQNFVIDNRKGFNIVYLIDFGLSTIYFDPITKQHIKYRESDCIVGNPRYSSIHTQMGIEQTRRDDLESLAYVLIYLAKGKLPWNNMVAPNFDDKLYLIAQKKMKSSPKEICEGLPSVFEDLLSIARSLTFDYQPDYTYLRQLFRNCLLSNGYTYDNHYDWDDLKD